VAPESSVVAVGVFDGLHRGHQAILQRALERARERRMRAGVVSFDPHPDVVLHKGSFRALPPLLPASEKRRRLLAMGAAWIDVIPFTRELAALGPDEFCARHLIEAHGMTHMVVGEDFALGRGRAGNTTYLRALGERAGFTLETVPWVLDGGEPVTSTRIREALSGGRVAEAARLLGRAYGLTGSVVTGHAVGRSLGYPTANLRLHEEQWLPMDGVYVARAEVQGTTWPAAMSIGTRPTFGGDERALEAFLLDFAGDLRGRSLTVELLDWVRPQERFESPAALVQAMDRDVARVREHFAGAERA